MVALKLSLVVLLVFLVGCTAGQGGHSTLAPVEGILGTIQSAINGDARACSSIRNVCQNTPNTIPAQYRSQIAVSCGFSCGSSKQIGPAQMPRPSGPQVAIPSRTVARVEQIVAGQQASQAKVEGERFIPSPGGVRGDVKVRTDVDELVPARKSCVCSISEKSSISCKDKKGNAVRTGSGVGGLETLSSSSSGGTILHVYKERLAGDDSTVQCAREVRFRGDQCQTDSDCVVGCITSQASLGVQALSDCQNKAGIACKKSFGISKTSPSVVEKTGFCVEEISTA